VVSVTDQRAVSGCSGLNDPLFMKLRPHTVVGMGSSAKTERASYGSLAVAGVLSIHPAYSRCGSRVQPIDLVSFVASLGIGPGTREDLS
jgi:hypothetical protein